ncbi:MAG: radical SAM protein [Planctomycetota bacterium]
MKPTAVADETQSLAIPAAIKPPARPSDLIVDLNNFARYPSLSVGYLTAVLREAGHRVNVFAPLMIGIGGVVREAPVAWYGLPAERLNYRLATSRSALLRGLQARLKQARGPELAKQVQGVTDAFARLLETEKPDAVLMSTYLMYKPHVEAMGQLCEQAGVPSLMGGPYFAAPEVAEQWMDVPGQVGLAGGELELELPSLIERMVKAGDLTGVPGVWHRDPGSGDTKTDALVRGGELPPLRNLDDVPIPDFSDFPWDKYPNRIVPVLTGRGCGWGRCQFCSDVTSTAGRSFRSHSPQRVLEEIRQQHERYGVDLFVFTDLKLNSDLRVWRAILENMQTAAPGSRWVASVHVQAKGDNGLSGEELQAAADSGCVRLTTGLESGSQRMLDAMDKGTDLAVTDRVLRAAANAGISVRTTMILGYPGETADDVHATDGFLRNHRDTIERVSLNRFQVMSGTPIEQALRDDPARFEQQGFTPLTVNHTLAQIDHRYDPKQRRAYRKAVMRLLAAVHAINRKPLRERARDFEGVM